MVVEFGFATARSGAEPIVSELLHQLVVQAHDQQRRRPLADEQARMLLAHELQRHRRRHAADCGPQKRVRRQFCRLLFDRPRHLSFRRMLPLHRCNRHMAPPRVSESVCRCADRAVANRPPLHVRCAFGDGAGGLRSRLGWSGAGNGADGYKRATVGDEFRPPLVRIVEAEYYLVRDDCTCFACSRCATNAGRTLTSSALRSAFCALGISVLSTASSTCWWYATS